ncbi:hypothetical protein NEH48_13530, partial [Xanthomonas hortorum pv. pelargonii]|nr:hypothetical protein [Xanthomonas hortorum pv. pelargonii]
MHLSRLEKPALPHIPCPRYNALIRKVTYAIYDCASFPIFTSRLIFPEFGTADALKTTDAAYFAQIASTKGAVTHLPRRLRSCFMSAVSHSLRNLVRCALLFLLIGTLPLAHARTRVLKYAGVNLSGAEF